MINQGAVGTPSAPTEDAARRRAQIVDAALHVMAEHGFRGASIKRIAHRAGLKSPALIYWYFKDKQAVFDAVIEHMAPFLAIVADPEPLMDQPPEVVLPRIIDGFLRTTHQPQVASFVRVLLSEAARHPIVATYFAERGPLLVVNFLERYLAHQATLGHLRQHNSAAAARAFMGMLVIYVLGREVFTAVGRGFPPREVYAAEISRIFLDGLQATPA